VAGAVKFLETKGETAKVIEVMDGMLAAIPDEAAGDVKCADVAVALVTTMTGGSVEARASRLTQEPAFLGTQNRLIFGYAVRPGQRDVSGIVRPLTRLVLDELRNRKT